MNTNGQLARRVGKLEELAPVDITEWAARAIPIMEQMAVIPVDADWNAPGSWFDLQAELFEATGSKTWAAVDEKLDAYIALVEARA